MKRRTPIIAVITTVVLTVVGFGPAHAEPGDPVVSDLDASTAGHVLGTVTSVAPYVSVRLSTDVAPQIVTLTAGTGTFDLATWGYSGTLPVYVASCAVAAPALPSDCSTEVASTATFTPTDVVPDVTWPTDTTVGPGDGPVVTVSDPAGGGDLRAIWVNPGDDLETAVTRDVATPLTLSDGSGFVRLVRCRAGSTTVCAAFSPDQKVDLVVRTVVTATVGPVNALTASSPTADVTVDTDATGTYQLTWSLEQSGTPVAGYGGSTSGTLDGSGAADPFMIDGGGLLDGSYDVVVSISVTDPSFGAYPAAGAVGTVTVAGAGPTTTATIGPVDAITQNHPGSTVTVDTDQVGTYTGSWSLEQGGTPVTSGSFTGTLDANGAATFTVNGTTLADGAYDIAATITVTRPGLGTLPAAAASGALTVDKTGPTVTLTRSVATIYPLIATTSYPTLSRIDVTGDLGPVTGFVVRNGNGTVVRNLVLNVNKTVWNGRDNAGKVVSAGTYFVFAVDTDGNRSVSSASVTVSRQTLVLKKFVKELSASGSLFDKFIGKCSTLRSPSARGTRGSLGFYSNTKCGTQTFASSAVSTAHAIRVPAAAKYVDLRVDVTGGAATAKKYSKGIIRYLSTKGSWTNETVISSTYGIHRGPVRPTTGLIDPNQFLVWGFVTAYGSRYDVIRFTVVVRYYALS